MKTYELLEFRQTVWDFYREHGRAGLPWRVAETDGSFDPYKILVSEVMLQQTQVGRVVPKYTEFLARFPDVRSLARASLGEVLAVWNGLGYNRRAKYFVAGGADDRA
jgi:A/G-specific adenine glycosylase